MIRKYKFSMILTLTLLLSGCGSMQEFFEPVNEIVKEFSGKPSETANAEEVFKGLDGGLDKAALDTDNNVKTDEYDVYEFYIEAKGYKPAKFEPESGCYAGAYIKEDLMVSGSIRKFEEMCRSNHAVYMIKNKLSETFVSEHMLECVSLGKTPCIMIEPPEEGEAFDLGLMEAFALAASELDIPTFFILYPYSSIEYRNADEYKKFFREAANILKRHLNNAAVIWSVRCFDYDTAVDFYPGDAYVDWVAVSAPLNIQKLESKYLDPVKGIDYLYNEFSGKKPMWLNMFISHYSSVDNVYYSSEKIDMLTKLYSGLENQYPRIKSVIYENFNGIKDGKGNDYLITEDSETLSAYSGLLNGSHFLAHVEEKADFKEYFPAGQSARVKDGEVYFPEGSLARAMNIPSGTNEKTTDIGGEAYIAAADLINTVEFDFFQDMEARKIYLSFSGH